MSDTTTYRWLAEAGLKKWREELAAVGNRCPYITPAGGHALNLSMFELVGADSANGTPGYSPLQQREFSQEAAGYRAVKGQALGGTGCFDAALTAVSAHSLTVALAGSMETEQFNPASHVQRVVACST